MHRGWLVVVLLVGLVSAALARSPQELRRMMSHLRIVGSTPAVQQDAGPNTVAGLFWHTDLDVAIEVARRENKPILSLRLLGRLDEELSCANSRFFRKMLYVDPQVAQAMQSYVLHWESVRPVPIVTIDYGNGTVVKRTLTGNSIHYLLSPQGQVIDALPGLMDADTFRRELNTFASFVMDRKSPDALGRYYRETEQRLAAMSAAVEPARPVDRAMRLAVSKAAIETRVLANVKNPSQYVREDTIKNQKELRPQILAWLKASPNPDLKAFNEKVYAELFLAPMDDPYMGLALPDEAAIFEETPRTRLVVR